MNYVPESVDSQWGPITQGFTIMSDGEPLVHEWFELAGDTEIMIRAGSTSEVSALLPAVDFFLANQEDLVTRAIEAVVKEFAGDTSPVESSGFLLSTVEVLPNGGLYLHLDDSEERFEEGYWPAVSFTPEGEVVNVAVEA